MSLIETEDKIEEKNVEQVESKEKVVEERDIKEIIKDEEKFAEIKNKMNDEKIRTIINKKSKFASFSDNPNFANIFALNRAYIFKLNLLLFILII